MSEKLKVFTLKLSKWLRDNSKNSERAEGRSALYDPKSRTYCCIGMFGRQCGVSAGSMAQIGRPDQVPIEYRRGDFADLVTPTGDITAAAAKAIIINDSRETSDAEKIAALRPIFRELGYKIVVVP